MLKFEAKKGDFAKIWQKLGGGYSPPPAPPGSAAHDFALCRIPGDLIKQFPKLGLRKRLFDL